MKSATVIGGGLSGLYASAFLAKNGYEVNVYEKNEDFGGRSRVFRAEGFKFDMGPSWYWMPELIDDLFEHLNEKRSNYFSLKRLDPGYQVFWKDERPTKIPADFEALKEVFDGFEFEGGNKLEKFIQEAKIKYDVALEKFMFMPGHSWKEFLNQGLIKYGVKLDLLKSVQADVNKRFKSEKARLILGFPVLFLGDMPTRIPALYTLMNYADLKLGTWYPEGGMSAIANALIEIGKNNGVKFHNNSPLQGIDIEGEKITGLQINDQHIKSDKVIFSGDYRFMEQEILPPKFRRYSTEYWDDRKLAPSCLIYYLGINKKVPGLIHHNLFFDEDLMKHGASIFQNPEWPEAPLFYVCAPSKTDQEVAPKHGENLFVLIPIAPGLKDTQVLRDQYFEIICQRLKSHIGEDIKENIVYKRDYCIEDFKQDYNAFKGNAYGLANTLKQTAIFKPKLKSKLKNLIFCGQLTVPGPGVPPSMISGQLAAKELMSIK